MNKTATLKTTRGHNIEITDDQTGMLVFKDGSIKPTKWETAVRIWKEKSQHPNNHGTLDGAAFELNSILKICTLKEYCYQYAAELEDEFENTITPEEFIKTNHEQLQESNIAKPSTAELGSGTRSDRSIIA